ncbi:alpha/beta hydrolase [Skermania piniformis]|uniref:Esterase family protein n=1 Tax=Skermania pinensis TaxID=39122 RepID=A0ABX8S8L2_9ACTN|nr:alpha/beta hydrolase family protein [Skermania piniformis]QXQ14214.1 esterase family protein [Skermania piniformis]
MRREAFAAMVLAFVVTFALQVLAGPSAGAATVVGVTDLTPTRTALFVQSPAMGQVVQVQVLHPAGGAPRPTYYLLDGLLPGDRESTWTNATDAVQFFADKNVNVVLPVGGPASYYTDWDRPDPQLGNYKWETFLTEELPPIIDAQFSGNGVNAIGGLSMGGNSAFILATRKPWLYRAVAGYSACPDTSLATPAILFSIASHGGDPQNMWGPVGGPQWSAHDPAANANQLRGKTIYLSTGTGLPGPHELELKPQLPENILAGGPVETGVFACVSSFDQRLRGLGIPARVVYRPSGTHSWSYYADDLHDSWPTIGPAIGA